MYQLRQSTLYNHYIAPPEIFIYTIIKIDFNDFCKPPHTNHTLSYMSNDLLLCNGMNKKKVPMEKEKCHLRATLPILTCILYLIPLHFSFITALYSCCIHSGTQVL